ncbi:hypothetical protein HK405_009423, partial [Cladochytrium tenue]
GLSFAEAREFVRRRRLAYAAFGTAAAALEIVPVLNCVFVFSNVVAAALWAADLEDAGLAPEPNAGPATALTPRGDSRPEMRGAVSA